MTLNATIALQIECDAIITATIIQRFTHTYIRLSHLSDFCYRHIAMLSSMIRFPIGSPFISNSHPLETSLQQSTADLSIAMQVTRALPWSRPNHRIQIGHMALWHSPNDYDTLRHCS
jgi:hypothetical protein